MMFSLVDAAALSHTAVLAVGGALNVPLPAALSRYLLPP